MNVLFVNACVRGEKSRTLRLADAFLSEMEKCLPDVSITEQNLPELDLQPMNLQTLAEKEALCDARAWDAPTMAAAVAFQQADVVVIAAPYWDMSFPAMLKIWVEHMYVRNLTFCYQNDQSVGLCRGKEAVYLTSAGSPIGQHDWGTGYIRDVMQVLGIPGFTAVKAEALDLEGRDKETIVSQTCEEAKRQARALAKRLQG